MTQRSGNRLEVGRPLHHCERPGLGAAETLSPSSSVEVRRIHADGDCVGVEHSGRHEMPDCRRYDNNDCRVLCALLNDGRSGGTRNLKDDPSHLGLRVPRKTG
jgi:ketosteroid isomerase-like protein